MNDEAFYVERVQQNADACIAALEYADSCPPPLVHSWLKCAEAWSSTAFFWIDAHKSKQRRRVGEIV